MADDRYGRVAEVDLGTGAVAFRRLPAGDVRRFLGGGGIAAKLLIDSEDGGVIIIANGLLTGLPVPTACKTSMLFRSPLTGVLGETSVGGMWGAELRKTGIDIIILRGESRGPVYLFITDDAVEIRDARKLWGMDTFDAHDALASALPPGSRIGVIGPAGEREVLFASLMFEGTVPRAAGRTGVGAVFGAKKIKGIVVKGTGRPVPADPAGLKARVSSVIPSIREGAAGLHNNGTGGSVVYRESVGDLPIKNFAAGSWSEGAARIAGSVYGEKMQRKHLACFACPIACAKSIEFTGGDHAGVKTSQPEYETIAAFGSNLMNDDPEELAVQNMLCNRYGIDTISAGVVIGFLFECVERGIVTREEIGGEGVNPAWGDNAAIRELIRMIAFREGIGDLLADGVRRAAERIGKGSEKFAVHARGLELPMHDPRGGVSSAVTYATGNRGGSHSESLAYYVEQGTAISGMGFPDKVDPHDSAGKGEITAKMQNLSAVFDALGLCKFLMIGGVGPGELRDFLEGGAGISLTEKELLDTGDRIYTLKRIYNQRLGAGRESDMVSHRVIAEQRGSGGAAGVLPDLDMMKDELYRFRGWDREGRVTREHTRSLGLEEYFP
ncbi:MAG: aldehyde ferredoxin oxidoreductase family protein [Spirochaetes bacterium]|nr:aldehyde ferredoxin oxidoreductase family protein [Spirochaetota bacterium]